MAKRFTLTEAQLLIPKVDALLREAVAVKQEYVDVESEVQAINQRVTMMGGMMIDRDHAIDIKNRRQELAARLRETIEKVQEVGCLIKDLDIGLIDFPTIFRGTEVYLCWKLGESEIAFWHGVDEGFRGRKPIDQDFLENHHGE